jgi:DNA-binding helix-hairpin-helix protein with protein kinase domain
LSEALRTGSGRRVRPDRELAEGAAGAAFTVAGEPDLVLKVLAEPAAEDERRLKAMLQVVVPVRVPGAAAVIAWPTDLVFDEGGRWAGFLMPSAPEPSPVNLSRLAHRREREIGVPNLAWNALLTICANYAAAVAALHAFPIVVSDINLKNVVVSGDLTVTVIDCDSVQIEVGGRLYGSRFYQDEFLAPELKGVADLHRLRREQTSDLWALAVLIWMTLMDGHHPFAGVWNGSGEPEQDDHAAAGRFPYAPNAAPLSPSPEAPPWRALPKELQALFVVAFTSGAQRPERRPTALEWSDALVAARSALTECDGALGRRHRFPATEKTCPWCEYERYLASGPASRKVNRSKPPRPGAAAPTRTIRAAPPVPTQAGASDLLVVPFAVVAHAVPVGALIAQGGLGNPGAANAIPIWIAGFVCGLSAWAVARRLANGRTDWLGRYLATPVPYLVVGFLLWMISGFILYS